MEISARVLVETRCRAYDGRDRATGRPGTEPASRSSGGPEPHDRPAADTVVSPHRRRGRQAPRADEGRDQPGDRAARLRVLRRLLRLPLRDDARGRPTPRTNVLDASGIKVYVDGQSIDLLQGSQIDYVDTLMGAGFTVNNPNAVAACGCGSSFRTADDAGSAEAAHTDQGATPRRNETATQGTGGPPAVSSIRGLDSVCSARRASSSQREIEHQWRSRSSRSIRFSAPDRACPSTSSRSAIGRSPVIASRPASRSGSC